MYIKRKGEEKRIALMRSSNVEVRYNYHNVWESIGNWIKIKIQIKIQSKGGVMGLSTSYNCSLGSAALLLFSYFWIRKKTSSPHKSIGVPKGPTYILPDDIMVDEILIRLPVKTLLKFKCVSKDWNDFISDDYFRRRYVSRQLSLPAGLFDFHLLEGIREVVKFLSTTENHAKDGKLIKLLFFHSKLWKELCEPL